MKVSVVIATYRRERSLYNALSSLTQQTYKDFEVVLVDDNADSEWNAKVVSTLDSFCDKIVINYIRNETNHGSAKTRNLGIYAAKGDYVTFLDDDDLYLPDKIEIQVKQMISENADYSLSNLSLFYEDETLSEHRKRDYLLTSEARDLLLCHLKYHMTGTDTMMFKRDYLLSIGGFDEIDVGDEFYLMMKAIKQGGRFVYCNSSDVKAYVHTGEGGLSSGQKKIEGENKLYTFKKQFYKGLKPKDKRFIRMRHYAVLAFAYKRGGYILHYLALGLSSFLSSPIQCLCLLKNAKRSGMKS